MLHSLAVKVLPVLKWQCWRQVFENLTLFCWSTLPRNQCIATYEICKVWSTRGDISSAECLRTEAKLLICLFSFDCNTSSLRCLYAAHVLLKKAQRAHAGLVWSTGAQAREAAEIDEKAFQIGKCKLAVYVWNTWPMPQMRVRDRNVLIILIWLRNCVYFIYFFSWMGGEKASQCVGHVTLSLRQGEGNHTLLRFPSQILNFLFLLVLFVCWENFKVYSLYITMVELVALGGGTNCR